MENCGFKEALKLLGGGETGFKPSIRKPTNGQRKKKREEQIYKEWLKCLECTRAKAPVLDIDLSALNERALNNLVSFIDPEYIRQLHRLPYLEHLVFEEADT